MSGEMGDECSIILAHNCGHRKRTNAIEWPITWNACRNAAMSTIRFNWMCPGRIYPFLNAVCLVATKCSIRLSTNDIFVIQQQFEDDSNFLRLSPNFLNVLRV